MQDERREIYQRLVTALLAMQGFRSQDGGWVRKRDVIGLLAGELLADREEPDVGDLAVQGS